MDSTKNFVQLSPLVSLAMAVVASFCIVNAQLALAHRPLRPSPSQDGPTDFLDTYDDAYGCGFFSTSDPEDAGISHQACYGSDGAIEFCW